MRSRFLRWATAPLGWRWWAFMALLAVWNAYGASKGTDRAIWVGLAVLSVARGWAVARRARVETRPVVRKRELDRMERWTRR